MSESTKFQSLQTKPEMDTVKVNRFVKRYLWKMLVIVGIIALATSFRPGTASATELPSIDVNCSGDVIAKVLVDSDDGTVWVDDNKGGGTGFHTQGWHEYHVQGQPGETITVTTRKSDGVKHELSILVPGPCVPETTVATTVPVSILTQQVSSSVVTVESSISIQRGLPETGRPTVPFLALGTGAVLGGIGIIAASRRRPEQA